jgi:hypothetical protein
MGHQTRTPFVASGELEARSEIWETGDSAASTAAMPGQEVDHGES